MRARIGVGAEHAGAWNQFRGGFLGALKDKREWAPEGRKDALQADKGTWGGGGKGEKVLSGSLGICVCMGRWDESAEKEETGEVIMKAP